MRNENSFINIYDISGRIVYTSQLDKKGLKLHTIASQKLKIGTYIISLNSNGKTFHDRLIVN